MRVREILKTEIKLFFSKYLFCILISLTRAPLGSGDQRAPLGGGHFGPPDISRTTQGSDKRQTVLDSPDGELSKAYKFFENRGHGSGQTEVKCQILLFLTMATTETK